MSLAAVPPRAQVCDHHSGRVIAAYKLAAGAHVAIMAAHDPVSDCLSSPCAAAVTLERCPLPARTARAARLATSKLSNGPMHCRRRWTRRCRRTAVLRPQPRRLCLRQRPRRQKVQEQHSQAAQLSRQQRHMLWDWPLATATSRCRGSNSPSSPSPSSSSWWPVAQHHALAWASKHRSQQLGSPACLPLHQLSPAHRPHQSNRCHTAHPLIYRCNRQQSPRAAPCRHQGHSRSSIRIRRAVCHARPLCRQQLYRRQLAWQQLKVVSRAAAERAAQSSRRYRA